ncbi:sulfatase family protein [Pseudozobellia thermophila]|uniref:Arylsulfatase A n=1 Tax=Pseudozobellia thermophila TaxID=192903 RepID=A0A1M6KVM2_9FLAO|nr:arylsulfatase [Pseudozobellia thermophila]SHJ62884.1 Arylsulfatase A [Pseudozobellia thermophila]
MVNKLAHPILKKVSIALCLSFFLSSCNSKTSGKEKDSVRTMDPPNIVYILADDMGYGDLSSLNSKSGIRTPNMDKIVEQGIYFTDAHSNSAVCTPTRYGVLTGRYAWRSRLKEGVLWGYDPPLIEENRTTVASFLRGNGYRTACIGKWHLGLGWHPKNPDKPIAKYEWDRVFEEGADSNVDFSKRVSGPNTLGFDYSYIIPASLDMTPYLYLENERATELPTAYTPGKSQEKDGRGVFWRAGEVAPNFDFYNVLGHLTKKATGFIKKQEPAEKPFFLYFPLTAPHTPWLPTEDVNGKSKAGRYGDFVTLVDRTVGEVLKALEESGQADNTLIIVTSDNGSNWTKEDKEKYAHRANYIYRGQKADIYEGGHRIPFIARWPGKIEPGSVSDQVMCTTDLLATLAGIIGKDLSKGAGEDSYNMLPAFTGKAKNQIRDYTVHHSLNGFFAIRKGPWKLTTSLGSGGFTKPDLIEPEEGQPGATLYNLEEDPKETNNRYEEHPEVVRELLALLEGAKR